MAIARQNEVQDAPLALGLVDRSHGQTGAESLLNKGRRWADEFLAARAPQARLSALLRTQLGWYAMAQTCSYFGVLHNFDPYHIVAEISFLEGKSSTATKPQDQFDGPLKGFAHKHFTQPSMLVRNLMEEVCSEAGFSQLWNKEFKALKAADPTLRNEDRIDKLAGLIAHTFVIGAHKQRAGIIGKRRGSRMTGEWIVFDHYRGRNRYLCVAPHMEDRRLSKLLMLCAEEFPDIEIKLRSNGWQQ